MKSGVTLTKELAAWMLKQLRPIDVSLGVRVLCGSPLKPRPSLQELLEPDARLFWLAALTNMPRDRPTAACISIHPVGS